MSFDFGWQLTLELLLLGGVTGYLAGLFGIGGGMLLVPFMTMVMGLKGFPADQIVKVAVATSLATICFTSIASVRAHHARGAVRWAIAWVLAPGIAVGSLLGAQIAKAMSSNVLAIGFGLFMIFSSVQTLRGRKPQGERELPRAPGMFGVGTLIGVLATLVGAGGAFISVPFITRCKVPIHHAVGTAAALGFPIALAGTAGYVIAGWSLEGLPPGALGFVYLPAVAVISLASMSTASMGARMAHRLNVIQLRKAFAVLLLLLSVYMLYRGIAG